MKLRKMICCAICVLCVFALISCAAQPPSNDGGSTAQSTENMHPSTEINNIAFRWNAKIRRYPHIASVDTKGQWLTYESCKKMVDDALQKHGICDVTKCSVSNGEEVCVVARHLKSISYPEAFFRENSLLMIPVSVNAASAFSVKDVVYDAGSLYCIFQGYTTEEPLMGLGANTEWGILIEVDTVLPQETQINVEWTKKTVETEEYWQICQDFSDEMEAVS